MEPKTYNGKECKHGHGTLRYKANGTCVVCNKIKSKAVAEAKKEAVGTRYFGKVCEKHPEANGERMTSSRVCVHCLAEKSKAIQKKNGYPVMKRLNEKLATAVFDHYGHKCCKCGIDDPDVLTIDHINQDGTKHRQRTGRRYTGTVLYRWLIDNGFPEGFRTLCYNCNIKAYVEHKRRGSISLAGQS